MRTFAVGGLVLVLCTLAGCTINTGKDETEVDADDSAGGAAAGSGAAAAETSGTTGTGGRATAGGSGGTSGGNEAGVSGSGADEPTSAFTASNLPPTAKLNGVGDLVLTGECEVDGKLGTISCRDGKPVGYEYELLKQSDPDGTNMAVFSVRSLTVESGANVSIVGTYAVGFIASDTININGGLVARVEGSRANGGGFAGVDDSVGLGPGAGGPPVAVDKAGPGGGAFCGKGGPGGGVNGPSTNGGTPYGNKTLIPLVGGSSGGAAPFGGSGAGGGGIQLVAKISLNIGATGSVAAPGGGGGGVTGSGAGSGGGVLLEAPSVRIAGAVSANGGGASAYSSPGQRGRADGKAAQGGGGDNPGGEGSSAASADGRAGVWTTGERGGAGGGGAGYIRINTADGSADISGTISPSLDTGCSSVGKLAAK